MTYGSEVGVEAINAHFVNGYTSTSTPSSDQIADFLADGYDYINARLAKAGYQTPVDSSASCYGVLRRLNNLFAAAAAEEATNVSTAVEAQQSRSERLWRRFQYEFDDFLRGDLTLAGLVPAPAALPSRHVRAMSLYKRDGYSEYFDPDRERYTTVGSARRVQMEP